MGSFEGLLVGLMDGLYVGMVVGMLDVAQVGVCVGLLVGGQGLYQRHWLSLDFDPFGRSSQGSFLGTPFHCASFG